MEKPVSFKKKHPVVTKAILVAATIVLTRTVIWSINYAAYDKYISDNYVKVDVSYNMYDGTYSYTVKKPYFHSFSGNFGILNDDNSVAIVIWPNIFITGEYEVGLMLLDPDTQQGYMFYTDNDLNYLADDNRNDFTSTEIEEINYLLSLHSDELHEMYSLAKAEWNLE